MQCVPVCVAGVCDARALCVCLGRLYVSRSVSVYRVPTWWRRCSCCASAWLRKAGVMLSAARLGRKCAAAVFVLMLLIPTQELHRFSACQIGVCCASQRCRRWRHLVALHASCMAVAAGSAAAR
jgi:hypothetical protein